MKKGVFIILGLALVVIIGVTVIFFMSSSQTKEPLTNYIEEGKGFLEKNDYSKSVQSFKRAIIQEPTNSSAYIELAKIYILKNDLTSAIDLLNVGVTQIQGNQSLHYYLANTYFLKGEYLKTEENLLIIAPDYSIPGDLRIGSNGEISSKDVVKLFLTTLNKLDKYDISKSTLEKYLVNSNDSDAYLNILAGLLNYATLDVANSYYIKALNYDDNDDLTSLRKMSDELKVILASTKDDAKGEFADTNKSNVARFLISYEFNTPAINILSDVISRNLEFDQLYFLRGVAYFQKGELDKAQIDLEKANSLDPAREETLVYMGRTYDSLGNVQKSIETYEILTRLFPNNELVLHDYAKMLYKEEMYSQSVNQYLKLISKNTVNQSKYRIELAKIYLDKVANYGEVLVITNELVNKWSGYAEADGSLKAEILTLETWATYSQLTNTDPEKLKIDDIIEKLNESLVMDPYNIRTNLYLGKLYVVTKDFTKARLMLENVINYELDNEFTPEAKQLIETKVK